MYNSLPWSHLPSQPFLWLHQACLMGFNEGQGDTLPCANWLMAYCGPAQSQSVTNENGNWVIWFKERFVLIYRWKEPECFLGFAPLSKHPTEFPRSQNKLTQVHVSVCFLNYKRFFPHQRMPAWTWGHLFKSRISFAFEIRFFLFLLPLPRVIIARFYWMQMVVKLLPQARSNLCHSQNYCSQVGCTLSFQGYLIQWLNSIQWVSVNGVALFLKFDTWDHFFSRGPHKRLNNGWEMHDNTPSAGVLVCQADWKWRLIL